MEKIYLVLGLLFFCPNIYAIDPQEIAQDDVRISIVFESQATLACAKNQKIRKYFLLGLLLALKGAGQYYYRDTYHPSIL